MANCPNCGSEKISIKEGGQIDWCPSLQNWPLLENISKKSTDTPDRNQSPTICMNCGISWDAIALFNAMEIIKQTAKKPLDLSQSSDREYFQAYLANMGSVLEELYGVYREANAAISYAEAEKTKYSTNCTQIGCATALVVPFIIFVQSIIFWYFDLRQWFFALMFFIASPIVGMIIGATLDSMNSKKAMKNLEISKRKAQNMRAEIHQKYRKQLQKFLEK
ncbi:hypothetical protein [Planktothricoides raciborskii]|uniref:Uncharacterized protein n=1 Tax=Planktothricoides raciborskii FACHB-1370 TaxID=2949576 RepID=A0ABR8EAA1_9CYAN|nr:hypothetical protein [Planktothricoides raciborskii]MBD2543337.1 hypothetical protein [Planktothricoides raciborskii FACHB-1370]MBD2581637.1 hypothetical protein [Planktothricoides raciborskii FACHB-1261]